MKRSIFLLILFSALGFLLVYFLTAKAFNISEDMGFDKNYSKRAVIADHDQVFTSLIRYTPDQLNKLNSLNDAALLNFRCGDELIRTNQGAYVLKNLKTSQKYKRTVKNQDFLEFMIEKERFLPKKKKILTARVCQLENNDSLLFYSIGVYNAKNVDNSTILQTVYDSTDNETFIQTFPKGNLLGSKIIKIDSSATYLYCNEPFQFSNNKAVYLLCNQEADKQSIHFIYEVNLDSGLKKQLGRCLNDFHEGNNITCN